MTNSKRNIFLALSAAALAGTALSSPVAAQAVASVQNASTHSYKDGSYAGPVYNAYYGYVQVQANIQNGQISSIDILQYPNDRRTSRYINSQAIPMLEGEVIRAQSANVNMISGATLTSSAFLRSLYSALTKASS